MEIQKFAKSVLLRKTKTEDLRRTGSWKPSKKSTLRFLSRTRSEPEHQDVGTGDEEEETESWVATLPDLPPMRPRKSPSPDRSCQCFIGPCLLTEWSVFTKLTQVSLLRSDESVFLFCYFFFSKKRYYIFQRRVIILKWLKLPNCFVFFILVIINVIEGKAVTYD